MPEFVRPAAPPRTTAATAGRERPATPKRPLVVGPADDALEREADAIADRVSASIGGSTGAQLVRAGAPTRIRRTTAVLPVTDDAGPQPIIRRDWEQARVTKAGGAALHTSDRKKKAAGGQVKVEKHGLKGRVAYNTVIDVDYQKMSGNQKYVFARHNGTLGYVRVTNVGTVDTLGTDATTESSSKT